MSTRVNYPRASTLSLALKTLLAIGAMIGCYVAAQWLWQHGVVTQVCALFMYAYAAIAAGVSVIGLLETIKRVVGIDETF
jgi:hypothetical protein